MAAITSMVPCDRCHAGNCTAHIQTKDSTAFLSLSFPVQVWDTELERTAEEWAETCLWEHGPAGLLPQIGQNLGAHWGR